MYNTKKGTVIKMRKYLSLTKRNCMVFLRDKSAVFFSLLSMLIVLVLMGCFLGGMNVENVTDLLAQYGGVRDAALDKENATHLVQYWTLAGIMVVNALTVTLTVVGTMISDSNENRLESFYSSPISRTLIAFSYISAAIIIGTLFCILTLAISLIYIVATGATMLSTGALLQILGYMIMNVCIFAAVMFLCALCVKSSSAWSGIATIVGTLVGFFGAIYLPMGNLPAGVASVLKYIPILHGTALMRQVFCREAMTNTFAGMPEQVIDGYKEFMGINIVMNDKVVSDNFQILFMVICGIVALIVSACLVRKKNINDR